MEAVNVTAPFELEVVTKQPAGGLLNLMSSGYGGIISHGTGGQVRGAALVGRKQAQLALLRDGERGGRLHGAAAVLAGGIRTAPRALVRDEERTDLAHGQPVAPATLSLDGIPLGRQRARRLAGDGHRDEDTVSTAWPPERRAIERDGGRDAAAI